METYNGHVRTPNDAIILFEACRLGLLPRVQRRLSEKERQSIRSGSVFVWDEREAGMRRWTDGKSWSASRVSGSFLTYREMEGKRGGNSFVAPASSRGGAKTPDSGRNSAEDQNPLDGEEGPDGYRYKPDGLMKQSFSLTTSQGQHLHLISYYSRSHPTMQGLRQPSNDTNLSSIQIPKGMYPESTVSDASNTPAVTRSPMPGAPNYVMAPQPAFSRQAAQPQPPPAPPGYYAGYIPHPGAYMYPISPMHTPPGHYALHPYAHPAGLPLPGYAPTPYGQPPHPQSMPQHSAPPSTYDQRPLRTSMSQPPPPLQRGSSSSGPAPLPPYDRSPMSGHHPTQSQYQTQSPTEAAERQNSYVQIDPRLTAASVPSLSVGTRHPYGNGAPSSPTERSPTDSKLPNPVASTASQVPNIGALMNDSTAPAIHTTEKEADRQGSTSPGGTKNGAPPQDIPSEKLAFREDKMALSKLDRVFARV